MPPGDCLDGQMGGMIKVLAEARTQLEALEKGRARKEYKGKTNCGL